MTNFNAILDEATARGDVPFVVAMYGDSKRVKWSGTSGNRSANTAATQDTVFRLFSMTKAIGSTAAMILMDRGKLDVDTPVEGIIPDFARIQVLDGFVGDVPILRAPTTKATVRHLATHTSGLVYGHWNANCLKFMEATDLPRTISGDKASLFCPMAFDPGTRWDYGIGIDWLGQVVEAIDGRRIDEFCQQEIFDPLDMPDSGFELTGTMGARLAQTYARGEDGKLSEIELSLTSNPDFYGMGHSMYSTAPDFMNFLRMFLNKGQLNGNRILSEAGVKKMLANNIGDLQTAKLISCVPSRSADVDLVPGAVKTHSLGFLRTEDDAPGMRSAGSQMWAGIANTHFWFDPASDVAGVVMTQLLPFVEKPFMDLYEAFERAVYSD